MYRPRHRVHLRETLRGNCPGQDHFALTEAQRETLIEASESGYLEVPRACSLAELGDRLEISDSSASERFRRGVNQLVRQTILSE
ncbi:helix-turn-helix domain-containing protein [Salinigranum sp. GCM10025319]|uniref:helix-turn-helix domain-containing protein n=1 Tax=Salinigranum sp. GCM10025319 TaxID=3252687 RepID=UPI00360D37A3